MKRLFFIGCLAVMAILFLPATASADECNSCHSAVSTTLDDAISDLDFELQKSKVTVGLDDDHAVGLKAFGDSFLSRNLGFESGEDNSASNLTVKCYNCLRYDKAYL